MKILVSGGAGFIGSMLVPALLSAGHQVTVVDNFMYHQTSLNHLCIESGLTIFKHDVCDIEFMYPLYADADIIIPLAALVGAPLCAANVQLAKETNFGAIKSMIQAIREHQKVIVPISNSGYGVGEPGKECTENTPMRPISLYGKTKVWAEEYLLRHHDNVVSLRLATVFGASPRMRLDLLVNDFVFRAVRDKAVVLFEPHFKRNYIAVRDVVRAFMFAIANFDQMKGQAYNVGLSDANLSKYELCQRIQAHIPNFVFMEAPIGEDPDKRDYIVSNAKIEALGFKPMFSLDMGISELIKLYQYLNTTVHGNT